MNPPRVVLDTNILVSTLLRHQGPAAEVRQVWRRGGFVLCSSTVLLDELQDVLSRPWFAKVSRLEAPEIREFIDRLSREAVLVEPETVEAVVRDPDDDHVLAAAMAARADIIVTGDKDLLVLQPAHRGIAIVTLKTFLESIGEEG
ncbi:MAG: putative toxin-antitoxin system toxin component, PIN family [Sumerlaeia bacterium]